jgi:hypothetical protein
MIDWFAADENEDKGFSGDDEIEEKQSNNYEEPVLSDNPNVFDPNM